MNRLEGQVNFKDFSGRSSQQHEEHQTGKHGNIGLAEKSWGLFLSLWNQWYPTNNFLEVNVLQKHSR